MEAWLCTDAGGNPLTGLVPAFVHYVDPSGVAITPQPAFIELGGGGYGFIPSANDVARGVAYLVRTDTAGPDTSTPPYWWGTIHISGNQFDALVSFDPTALTPTLWTGGPPVVGSFVDSGGNPRSGPVIVQVTTYFAITLAAPADIGVSSTYRIDNAAGAFPLHFFNAFQPPIGSDVTPVPTVSPTLYTRQSFGVQQDFGTDVSTFPDLDPSFALIYGNRVLAEAVVRRWVTVRGSLLDAPDYGCDVREYVNEAGVMGNIAKSTLFRMKSAMENEAKKDQRVANCVVNLNYNQATQTMVAQAELDTAGGPFKLELGITSVTVALLKLG